MYWDLPINEGGFDFKNYQRNQYLSQQGYKHRYMKTGTTIVGCIYNNGVVLGADTRATEDTIAADLDCEKLHYLAPNIYCAGAGTAADNDMITRLVSSELELQRLYTGSESRISHVESRLTKHLFRYQGHIGAALIIGGVDIKGPQLVNISPYGNSMRLPFTTMGSGSLAAMAILETKYKDNMTKDECVELVKDAIEAGIFNDLGSGSNVDIYVITREGVDKKESYRCYNKKVFTQADTNAYKFKKGTTEIIEEVSKKWKDITIEKVEDNKMQLD